MDPYTILISSLLKRRPGEQFGTPAPLNSNVLTAKVRERFQSTDWVAVSDAAASVEAMTVAVSLQVEAGNPGPVSAVVTETQEAVAHYVKSLGYEISCFSVCWR